MHSCLYEFFRDQGSLIGGIFALLAGAALYISGHQQIAAAKETANKQLRAYVFVSHAVVTNVVDGNGIPEAIVVIKNFGQTPAYDVIHKSGLAIDSYPPPRTLTLIIPDGAFAAPASTRWSLGPGATSTSVTSAGRQLTAPENLASGTGIIYVYGEIRYRDAFGQNQRTKYRLMMGGPVGVHGGLTGCEEGNEAT